MADIVVRLNGCFKRAKIARWRHCNADSLKTLKTNYMLIRLLCVYRMTTYVHQNFAFKFQAIAEKTAKNLRGYFFLPHPVYRTRFLSFWAMKSNSLCQQNNRRYLWP